MTTSDGDDWVQLDPGRPSLAEARLRDSWVHIWAVIGQLKAQNWNIAAVAAEDQVPETAIEAAIQFYQRHTQIIDDRLALNAA